MTDWRIRPRSASAAARERLVSEIESFLREREEIVFAYLHGSFITSEPFRDIDLAVYLTRGSGVSLRRYEIDAAVDLSAQMHMPIDVRVLNDAPVAFRYHALKGRLLFACDAEILDEFRARTWDEYCDFAPFARRYLREAIGE